MKQSHTWASLVAQMVKKLPAMQETWVQSLGQEDPLEKAMATHSCALVWRIPWTEEPGGLPVPGVTESQESDMTEHAHRHNYIYKTESRQKYESRL